MSDSKKEGSESSKSFTEVAHDLVQSYKDFCLKDHIAAGRLKANDYLSNFPKISFSLNHKTTTEIIEAPLHNASEYFQKEFPYFSLITKNHGYTILMGSLLVGLYPFRRLPFKYSVLAHSCTVGLTGAGLGVVNFKWNFPKKKYD